MTSEERALLDLGVPAAVILLLLNNDSGLTQPQLIELLGTTRTSITSALKKLERHRKITEQSIPRGDPLRRHARYIYRWSGGPVIGGAA